MNFNFSFHLGSILFYRNKIQRVGKHSYRQAEVQAAGCCEHGNGMSTHKKHKTAPD
jgi:DUF1680 family protein